MNHKLFSIFIVFIVLIIKSVAVKAQTKNGSSGMVINSLEYLEYQGVNVMLAHDFYPEGHQGGVGIIQNGMRVATNGDIRWNQPQANGSQFPRWGNE